jgi:hypothetical protein
MLPDPLHPAVVHLPMALAVLIPALALETGKDEEDRVERVVSEDLIEAHEEAAERFLLLGGIGLLAYRHAAASAYLNDTAAINSASVIRHSDDDD